MRGVWDPQSERGSERAMCEGVGEGGVRSGREGVVWSSMGNRVQQDLLRKMSVSKGLGV